MLARSIYTLLVGLVGAVLVHLVIVLLLPNLAVNTAWNMIANDTETFAVYPLTATTGGSERNLLLDPAFDHAFCRYDLNEGALNLRADAGSGLYWSASVHSDLGKLVYSANARIAPERELNVLVVNSEQMRYVRQEQPAEADGALVVDVEDDLGFVLIRILVPDDSWEPLASSFVSSIDCEGLAY